MSHPVNTAWLEAAEENLEVAVAQGNYPAALDVIADVKDAGFDSEARTMEYWLKEQPISKFHKVYSVDELITHLEKTGKVPPFSQHENL